VVTRTFVSLICDLCGKEEIPPDARTDGQKPPDVFVKKHSLTVDGTAVELEACEDCWPTDVIARLVESGRRPRR
jgi:hypothetical protein